MERFDVEMLAREGYSAYGAAAGWKTFDGRAMPQWESIGEAVQKRWRAAARRIAELATQS